MSKSYTQFDRDEFEYVLNTIEFDDLDREPGDGFRKVAAVDTRADELVYDLPLDHDDLSIRVFSSLDAKTGRARSKGADAIRTVVWSAEADAPVGGKKRTNRIETWPKNLRAKILALIDEYDEYDVACPECGAPMAHRDGKYGEFFGCTRYPKCDATLDGDADTESVDTDDAPMVMRTEKVVARDELDAETVAAMKATDDEVRVVGTTRTDYGLKLVIKSPFMAKDAIKALDWETTHRVWEPALKAWLVDADALDYTRNTIAGLGWSVRVPENSLPDIRH